MNAQDDLIARYLDHLRHERRLADNSLKAYAAALRLLRDSADEARTPLLAVRHDQIRAWAARMRAAGRSPRGMALTVSGWRGFYAWLGRCGQVAANPVQGLRLPRRDRPLPKALSVDETVRLADASVPQDSPWHEARDAAIFELLYSCGLRVSELAGLNVAASDAAWQGGQGWIDLAAAEVQVLGKGGKRRSVPLGRKAIEALRRWLAVRGQAAPASEDAARALFLGHHGTRLSTRSVQLRIKRRGALAGASASLHPHMLRHCFASHLLQSSQDLRGVQEIMGHASIAATQVYTRLDFQHLAQAYDAAHPRAGRRGKPPADQ